MYVYTSRCILDAYNVFQILIGNSVLCSHNNGRIFNFSDVVNYVKEIS